jgi:hypothetical protein
MLLNCRFRAPLFLAVCLVGIASSTAVSAHIAGQSQLGGWVYIDRNNDGVLAFSSDPNPEYVVGDIRIDLFTSAGNIETLVATTLSDAVGRYLFENINPGTYVLRETESIMFVDGIDTLGVLQSWNSQPIPGNALAGTMANNAFLGIVLPADVGGEFYNFGERGLTAGYASKRFLFGSYPGPPQTPPPPPGASSPEPTTSTFSLIAALSLWSVRGRQRRSGSF